MKAEYDARRKEIEEELKQIRKEREKEKQAAESKSRLGQLSIESAPRHVQIEKKDAASLVKGLFGSVGKHGEDGEGGD